MATAMATVTVTDTAMDTAMVIMAVAIIRTKRVVGRRKSPFLKAGYLDFKRIK